VRLTTTVDDNAAGSDLAVNHNRSILPMLGLVLVLGKASSDTAGNGNVHIEVEDRQVRSLFFLIGSDPYFDAAKEAFESVGKSEF
jgi:hypothetical protein